MPRRTQLFQKIPWTGGINTSVDSGVLSSNDLVQADNVVFAASSSRLKRQGFDYFDTALPAVIKRSSSGTTRTLQFSSSISITGTVNQLLVVGEKLLIAGAGNANYNTAAAIVASIATTTITNDTITYTFSGAASLTEALTAEAAATVTRNYDVIGVHDLWYFDYTNHSKDQLLVAVTSQGLVFRYDQNGKRKQVVPSGTGATALASSPAACDIRTFNNKCIITLQGLGNTPKYYDPMVADEWKDLPNAPDANIMQEHQGRLWMDDKLDPDKLHFSPPFDETQWQGLGDSGALYLSQGDGDNQGISAILPPYKGVLIVNKGTKSRQITGEAPEEYFVAPMTEGLGSESHKACVAVDLDDVYFMSKRGFHSLIATNTTGDFAAQFLSKKIQPTFNTWNAGRLKFTQGTYISNLNSVAWTVSENGQTKASSIWLYNPTIQNEDGTPGVWYRWPNLAAQSITTRLSSGSVRVVCGDDQGRIMIGQNGEYTDFNTEGISYRIKSGTIYPSGNPQTIVAFKKFGLLFRPRGRVNFTAYFKVDNMPVQAISFAQTIHGDTLGVAYILGQSRLGNTSTLAPFMKDVYGHGRGCTVEIFQTGADAQVEIYGYVIEFETADIADEVTQEE